MKNQAVKDLIIEKTKLLLNKHSNVTIKQIADACYINIAAVNYYFSSKDALLNIVIEDVLNALKVKIIDALDQIDQEASLEVSLEVMLELVYQFALDHTGIVKYLFLKYDQQSDATNQIVEMFFKENAFTKRIFSKMQTSMHIDNEEILYARYILLFSSFSIPIFIQMIKEDDSQNSLYSLKNPAFKKSYIKELLRIIHP
jgi:AcrR family transcriptional regulator